MTPDSTYIRLGKLTEDMHIDYERAIAEKRKLERERDDINEQIVTESSRTIKNTEFIDSLYAKYRENKFSLQANASYIQGLFEKFNNNIDEIIHPKEWVKEEEK